MTEVGQAHGAGTIVNAMATGKGAAFGLAWKVRANVRPASAWSVHTGGRKLPAREARLAIESAKQTKRRSAPLRIDVDSGIPAERGLKSSSAVSIAVINACLRFHGLTWNPQRVLAAAADAGLRSQTSLTGAYDDAAACLLGGVVVTDNRRRTLIRHTSLPKRLAALVHVPEQRLKTSDVRGTAFAPIRSLALDAWTQARAGHHERAMILNSCAYAPLWGHDLRFTLTALREGAWSAGLSGKGPAEIALGDPQTLRRIQQEFPAARIVALAPRRTP